MQDWDRTNHLYYGGIAFNRAKPANGSIWVARYNWNPPFTVPDYEFTGAFEDERLLGYACTGPTPATEGTFDLYWLAVDPVQLVPRVQAPLG